MLQISLTSLEKINVRLQTEKYLIDLVCNFKTQSRTGDNCLLSLGANVKVILRCFAVTMVCIYKI